MAQWTTIDPNTLLPGDPWTSAKAQAAFENVEAVAEGAAGAPRIQSKALGGVILPAFSTAATNGFAGVSDLLDYSKFSVNAWFQSFTSAVGSSHTIFRIRLSDNNGSSWGAAQNISIPSANTSTLMVYNVAFSLDTNTGDIKGFYYVIGGQDFSLGTFSQVLTLPTGDVNAWQIGHTGTGTTAAMATVTGGRDV